MTRYRVLTRTLSPEPGWRNGRRGGLDARRGAGPVRLLVLELGSGKHVVGLYDDITGYLNWAGTATITRGMTTFAPF
jgi:hypothetical protein